ncbi:MAG: fibronectin type III domain-containing protein [Planctomycetota bacterium]
MGVIPDDRIERINFFENRLNARAANAAAIGLSADEVTRIAQLTAFARDGFNAAQQAGIASRSATQAQDDAIDAMAAYGADLVKTIEAFAETSDDMSVYSTADIQLPGPRTPLGPVPMPANVSLTITTTGSISISWHAETRGRMAFVIERQTMPVGGRFRAWSIIGTTTTKNFVDETVPTGLERAVYRVTAERPGGRSQPSGTVTAYFGASGLTGGNGDPRIAE